MSLENIIIVALLDMEPLSARWRLQCEPRAIARVADEGFEMSKSADCNFPHVSIFPQVLIFAALFFYYSAGGHSLFAVSPALERADILEQADIVWRKLIGCLASSLHFQPISCRLSIIMRKQGL